MPTSIWTQTWRIHLPVPMDRSVRRALVTRCTLMIFWMIASVLYLMPFLTNTWAARVLNETTYDIGLFAASETINGTLTIGYFSYGSLDVEQFSAAYTAAKWTSIVALISTIVSGMTIFFWVRSPVVQVPRLAFYKSVTDIAGFSCCLTAVSELATFCLLFMEFDHEEVKYSISMLFTVLSAIAFSVLGIYSFHFGCRREAREPCRLREETDPNAIYAVRIALPSYEEHSKDAMVAPGAGCDAPNEDAPPEYESPPSYEDAGFDVEAASRAISSINL